MGEQTKLNIGHIVRSERQQLGISLEEASRKTGVSKTMLGQIEREESSPTLSTVWKISAGMHIPMAKLLAPRQDSSYHVNRLEDIEPVSESGTGIFVYNVFPFNPLSAFDYLYIKMDPHTFYNSTGHPNALEEYVIVTSGTLTMHVAGKTFQLHTGDSMTFAGDEEHAYENEGNVETIYQSMMRY